MKVSGLSEDKLLRQLTRHWRVDRTVLAGVGDDCAVLRLPGSPSNETLLFKTDSVVEGVHFTSKTPGRWVGRKALARVLSDVAAMGGIPTHALVTLGVPRSFSVRLLQEVYRGMEALAKLYRVNLVGGETTRTRGLLLSIALLGQVKGHAPVLRSGGRSGDFLWVTGKLGNTQKRKHLAFIPRLAEGQWLARKGLARAMCDVSDGLASDLPRLAIACGLGFELDEECVPRAPGATLKQAFCDGEDYELLFAASPQASRPLCKYWPFKTPLACIGRLQKKSAQQQSFPFSGYDHFQKH